MPQKLRERLYLMEPEDLKKVIDTKILPLEYGGEVSCSEMMERFLKLVENRQEMLRRVDEIEIDVEFVKKQPNDIDSDIGSFRKLEID